MRDPPEPRQFHVRNVMTPPAPEGMPYVVEREVAEKHRVHHRSRIWGAELKSVLKTTTAIHTPKRAKIVARILISELSAMKRMARSTRTRKLRSCARHRSLRNKGADRMQI